MHQKADPCPSPLPEVLQAAQLESHAAGVALHQSESASGAVAGANSQAWSGSLVCGETKLNETINLYVEDSKLRV